MLGMHLKTDKRLEKMEHLIQKYAGRWINGNVSHPSRRWRFDPLIAFGTISGALTGIGVFDVMHLNHASNLSSSEEHELNRMMARGAVAGATVATAAGITLYKKWYNAHANDYAMLARVLKNERLRVAQKGKPLSNEQIAHNQKVIGMVRDAIQRMRAHNQKAIEGLQA
ncbi:MAG: hypothetical protein AABW68_04240 [archaeon]